MPEKGLGDLFQWSAEQLSCSDITIFFWNLFCDDGSEIGFEMRIKLQLGAHPNPHTVIARPRCCNPWCRVPKTSGVKFSFGSMDYKNWSFAGKRRPCNDEGEWKLPPLKRFRLRMKRQPLWIVFLN